MEIIFKSISIKNFKGISDLHIDFKNKTILEGENGIGKTSVLDAITWCLFGKNFADEKIFKIKPIVAGEEKKDITTSVELIMNDKTIERILEGDKSFIKVDGVKFGINEFGEYLRDNYDITPEEFKSLSNIDYIPSLNWKDLRNLIMGLVGEIKIDDVLQRGEFDLIEEKIKSVGEAKTREDLTTTKSNLKNKIKKLDGNIDQKLKDIDSMVIDETETEELEKAKEALKTKINEYNDLATEKAVQDKDLKLKEDYTNELKSIEKAVETNDSLIEEYKKSYESMNIDVETAKKTKIVLLNNRIDEENSKIDSKLLINARLENERLELRKKYDEEVNKEIIITNDKCSVCNQTLPQNKIEEALKKAKDESIKIANGYALDAKAKLIEIEDNNSLIQNYKDNIIKFNKEIEEIENNTTFEIEETPTQKSIKQQIKIMEKRREELTLSHNDLENRIKELEDKILTHKTIDFIEDISKYQNELEDITQKLAKSDVLKEFKIQLKSLENQRKELIQEQELLNKKEQQLIAFNNTRSEMLKEKLKDNFKLVDFITQETTKDGKLIETFKLAINGIEYDAINTGHKILLALDLVENIQRLKNKKIPILIDGLGELTRLPELSTQIIGCRAKYQLNKKIEISEV